MNYWSFASIFKHSHTHTEITCRVYSCECFGLLFFLCVWVHACVFLRANGVSVIHIYYPRESSLKPIESALTIDFISLFFLSFFRCCSFDSIWSGMATTMETALWNTACRWTSNKKRTWYVYSPRTDKCRIVTIRTGMVNPHVFLWPCIYMCNI